MTNTTTNTTNTALADQLEALAAKATPGPYAIASDELEGDHKTIIERPSRSGMFGVPLLRAEHDWECSRISWAQAENLTALVHLMLVNLPAIIAAIRATDQQALAERDAEIARLQETLERIETFGTNWATGVEENLERVREIARLALGGNDAE